MLKVNLLYCLLNHKLKTPIFKMLNFILKLFSTVYTQITFALVFFEWVKRKDCRKFLENGTQSHQQYQLLIGHKCENSFRPVYQLKRQHFQMQVSKKERL